MPFSEKATSNPRPICNNAYSRNTHKAAPDGLSFAPQALFFALEAIVSHPAPNSSMTQPLRRMLAELEQHGIYGYFHLREYIRDQGGIVRKVRSVQKGKGLGDLERFSTGMRLLLDGITFRDMAKAYFEVVEELEKCGRKRKRKGLVMESEKSAVEAAGKEQGFLKENLNGYPIKKETKHEIEYKSEKCVVDG